MSTFHRVLSTFRNIALILTASGLVHAQVPVSSLPQATLPLSGNESVVMNQNGTTKQGKVSSITSLVNLSAATGITLTPNPIVGGAGTIGLTLPVNAAWGGTGELGIITGIPKANGTSAFTTASSSDVPIPGSNTQILYNSSGVLGASSLMTFTPASVVLNLGAATTPGTFSVGQLDTMVINGVTVPIPGFALNSNIQGVFENHSYVNGVAAGGARYYGVRSEGSITSPAIVVNGDHLSTWYAAGYNGTNYSLGASIMALVDGTPGASAMPTDLDFAVSPAGSQVPTSRLTLVNDGSYKVSGAVGTANQAICSGGAGVAASWCNPAPTLVAGNFANPSGLIGLSAVNGVATTATRSDATHALDQSIAPTWTGLHTYTLVGSLSAPSVKLSSSFPYLELSNSSGAADSKRWDIRANTTQLDVVTIDDAGTTARTAISFVRSAGAVNAVNIGNTTDNPPISQQGTGNITFNGGMIIGSATGSFKGAGTLNTAGQIYTNNNPIYPTINCSAGGPCNINGIAVGQTAYVVAAAQQDQASTTTLINDTELQFLNTPVGIFQGTIVLFTTGSGTGGFKWAFPQASTYSLAGAQVCGSNTLVFQNTATVTCSGIPGGVSITGQWNLTGSGTLALQWAQNASNATNTSRFATSAWTITRIK